MISRPSRTNWDFQEVVNRAVVERLGRDGAAAASLKSRLMESSDPSEIASLPRYLSAAGALDTEITQRCAEQLQFEGQVPVPRAGFDAVEVSVRSSLGVCWMSLPHPSQLEPQPMVSVADNSASSDIVEFLQILGAFGGALARLRYSK